MPKQLEEIPLVGIKLLPGLKKPLYQQLYEQLRIAILEKRFGGGKKLPGTRALAASLGLSRNTVNLAYEQLMIEGYIQGEIGAGSFITENLPEKMLIPKAGISYKGHNKNFNLINFNIGSDALNFSKKNSMLEDVKPFRNGVPALSEFPFDAWTKISNRVWRNLHPKFLSYGDTAGFKQLRIAIADYLKTYRAVNCTFEQILIVNGSQQGLDLIGRVFLNKKNKVWIEDPGYSGARISFLSTGAKLYPVPLTKEGIDLDFAVKNYPSPALVYTTPSHQYPLGYTMSISVRLKLLEWAKANGTWIIEDDYDSEFRYSGNPLQSLQGLDASSNVIYLGTFSKVLFPGLRLGYLVLPSQELMEQFIAAKTITDRQTSIIEQIIVSIFIEEGYFTKHLRRMRMLYKERQEFLISEINNELNSVVNVKKDDAGMHLIGWLNTNINEKKVSEELIKNNIYINSLSGYSMKFKMQAGLILGYTAFDKKTIHNGIQKMARILIK